MPYANPEDKKQHDKEYKEKNKELIKEKRKEYNQRPEVKEKKKEYMKNYNQIQSFKKRQEMGEESWLENGITPPQSINLQAI